MLVGDGTGVTPDTNLLANGVNLARFATGPLRSNTNVSFAGAELIEISKTPGEKFTVFFRRPCRRGVVNVRSP
jgi:hypothetical protein